MADKCIHLNATNANSSLLQTEWGRAIWYNQEKLEETHLFNPSTDTNEGSDNILTELLLLPNDLQSNPEKLIFLSLKATQDNPLKIC